ncbi:hypothetical protein JCM11641_006769 [Rhodosporidiobolus odoratus]
MASSAFPLANVASASTALVSPTKRSYRPSPNSSPDPQGAVDSTSSPRVLRTKLSNVQDEVRLELDLKDVKKAAPVAISRVKLGVNENHEGEVTTPNTPPEERAMPLVGLGMGIVGGGENGTASSPFSVKAGDAQDGSTQTATAERQTKDLMQMPTDMQMGLARLCSQHWQSEYNTLKRAVAAAAYETSLHPVPALPSYPHIPRVPSFPSSSQQASPSRTSNVASYAPPLRPSLPARPASDPATVTSAKKPAAQTALTPAMENFQFTPHQPSPASTAKVINSLLANLVAGEPVAVRTTPQKTVVVSESLPTPDKKAPIASTAPVEPPALPGMLPGMKVINGVAVKTSVSHPINISPLITPEVISHLSCQYSAYLSSSSRAPLAASTHLTGSPFSQPFLLRPTPSTDLLTLTSIPEASSCAHASQSQLGNFVLSSCPGKKVRLNGEPRSGGRGAICRDVALDLQRARDEHNVSLVVCCLDDTELAYLGVPWVDYAAAAAKLGIAVIRLPMVEGFAPESPAMLDAHLGRIVQDYTLKGKSVLAHCRGGIGRAGLVASCWMLKMGLVHGGEDGEEWKDLDTMAVVERLVELIRKRRSVKAIETAHQVHFLVQYVAYLQQCAHVVDMADKPASVPSAPDNVIA